jgi:hypothetical protein
MHGGHNKIPTELIQESLLEAYEIYGRPLTQEEWLDWRDRASSIKPIIDTFGSWAGAWASIGVDLWGAPHYGYPRYRRLPAELKSKDWLRLAYNGDGKACTPHSTHQIARHLDRQQGEVLNAMIAFEIPRRPRGQAISMASRGLTKGPFPILEELEPAIPVGADEMELEIKHSRLSYHTMITLNLRISDYELATVDALKEKRGLLQEAARTQDIAQALFAMAVLVGEIEDMRKGSGHGPGSTVHDSSDSPGGQDPQAADRQGSEDSELRAARP